MKENMDLSQGRLEGPQRSVTRKRWREGGTEEESDVIIFQLKKWGNKVEWEEKGRGLRSLGIGYRV